MSFFLMGYLASTASACLYHRHGMAILISCALLLFCPLGWCGVLGSSFSDVVIRAVNDPSVLPRSCCCGVVRGSLLPGVQPTQLYSSVAYGLALNRWYLVVLPPWSATTRMPAVACASTRSEATIIVIVEYCDLKTAAGFRIRSVASAKLCA